MFSVWEVDCETLCTWESKAKKYNFFYKSFLRELVITYPIKTRCVNTWTLPLNDMLIASAEDIYTLINNIKDAGLLD